MILVDFFFGTRIQINVSWYGSGSWPMIRIRNTVALHNKVDKTVNFDPWLPCPWSIYMFKEKFMIQEPSCTLFNAQDFCLVSVAKIRVRNPPFLWILHFQINCNCSMIATAPLTSRSMSFQHEPYTVADLCRMVCTWLHCNPSSATWNSYTTSFIKNESTYTSR